MTRPRRRLLAALTLLCLPAALVAADEPASDERVYRIGGPSPLLDEQLEQGVTDEPTVVEQFRRLGVGTACRLYNAALKHVLEAEEPRFRPLLVAAMRRQVPEEILSGAQGPVGWDTVPIQIRRHRIENDLKTTGAELFPQARAQLLRDFIVAAEREPITGGDAATVEFANWDLDRPLARKMACMLLRVGRPDGLARRKAAFDGFFTRMGTR